MLEVLNILLVVVLVLANGFFVAAEFALVGVRRSRVMTLVAAGDRRAPRLLRLVDDLNAYISATQLGITLASLGLGWIGEPAVAHLLEAPLAGRVSQTVLDTLAFAIAFSVITFLHIVLGELAPKTLALERAERVALAIAAPMEWFYKIFRWPIRLLDWAGTRTVRLFGLHAAGAHGASYTAEEIRQLLDQSRRSGHLEQRAQELLNRVLDFNDAEVRAAMVPRTAVAAVPVAATLTDMLHSFRTLGYSRLPVYRGHLDNIVGIVFMKDLLAYVGDQAAAAFALADLLHAPLFVPPTARLSIVLAQMQSGRQHFACVVDEHGGLAGIVTLEDLLEEIVGEIDDEYDEAARAQVVEAGGGAYLLDGLLAVREANRRLNLKLPEADGYTTIAGFLLAQAGRVLQPGETVAYEGARFTVERMDGHRIRRVRFTPGPPVPQIT